MAVKKFWKSVHICQSYDKQEIWANAHETRHSICLILYVCSLGLSQ